VAATIAENVGVPEDDHPAARPGSGLDSGFGRMAWTNLEKAAENGGFSKFRRICGNGLGIFAN
jgi:hypothetical protein